MIKNKKRKLFVRLSILGIMLAGSIIYLSETIIYKTIQKKDIKQSNKSTSYNVKNHPEIILKKFKLEELDPSKKENWILTAQKANIFHSLKKIECHNLKCKILKNKKIMATLSAAKGDVNQSKSVAILKNKVSGKIYDMKIEGENVKYDFKNKIIISDKKTIYKHQQFKMLANSSIIEIKKNRITMKNGVESEFNIK